MARTSLRKQARRITPDSEAKAVVAFNANNPVGTVARYWSGVRSATEPSRFAKTRSKAQLLSGRTAVVWFEGCASCIALHNVQVMTDLEVGEYLRQEAEVREHRQLAIRAVVVAWLYENPLSNETVVACVEEVLDDLSGKGMITFHVRQAERPAPAG